MTRYRSHCHVLQKRSSLNQTNVITSNSNKFFPCNYAAVTQHSYRPNDRGMKCIYISNKQHRQLTTQSSKYHKNTNNTNQQLQLDDQATYNNNDLPLDTFFITVLSRIIAGFGILHVFSEHCFEMTRCEGPSMMPTIQPSGEIILIEKMTHVIFGIEGGDVGEKRASNAQLKQVEWEKEEIRLWLAGKHRMSSSSEEEDDDEQEHKSKSSKQRKSYSKEEKDELMSVHTWYAPKLKEANPNNYKYLSSWKKCFAKLTSGIAVGDVVVLQHPDREGTVCKRVLALPGDTVIRPKQSYLSHRDRRIRRENHRDVMNTFQNKSKSENDNPIGQTLNNSSLYVVPDGHIWVEGDNSINSSDSRNYGPVSAALIVGKVWMKLWPLFTGNTIIVRGSPPLPHSGIPFKGSTSLPAGYNGETIVVQDTT